ncbi:MAG: hypothetical protein K9N46_06180 [Candidatus Marinimicrobia bacterium]|nr:hypothetical protein [Candidatus Neomarinimicrobiota bacterium]MCF7828566.1 hypothetical protein [Candidatus Neomarinimicrobiota bacterium]MCF7880307.1 hypothetical protein [Candidatus Neomarinimicrobiota bacterium]
MFWWWSTRYLSSVTNPTVAGIIRGIRLFALIGIILLVADFRINWVTHQNIPPTIAVFADDSQSLTDFEGQLSDSLEKILSEDAVEVQLFRFSGDVQKTGSPKALDFSGTETNLSAPLEYLKREADNRNYQAAILLSDGIHNSGPEPTSVLEDWRLPVYTMFIGDSTVAPDISLQQFTLPKYAYAGDSVTAQLRLDVQSLRNEESVSLVLRDNNQELASRTLSLTPGDYQRSDEVALQFEEPGEYTVSAAVGTVSNETDVANNSSRERITVKPSRYRVLVLSAAPSTDTRFLLNAIDNLERFESIPIFTSLSVPDSMPEAPDIIYLLGNSPEFQSYLSEWQNDHTITQVGAGGRMYLPGDSGEENVNNWQEHQVTLQRSSESPLQSLPWGQSIWEQLPPVWIPAASEIGKIRGTTILKSVDGNNSVITMDVDGTGRTIRVYARELWRWSFANRDAEESIEVLPEKPYSRVMEQVFYWLLQDTEFQRLQVELDTDSRNVIRATAQVYSRALEVAEVARVWGEVIDSTGQTIRRQPFTRDGNTFTFQSKVTSPGEYRLRAIAHLTDDTLRSVAGPVRMEDVEYELLNRQGRPGLLKQISQRSGGKLLENIAELPAEEFAGRPYTQQSEHHSFALRRAFWVWILLVILLGIDWWIRRRSGIL